MMLMSRPAVSCSLRYIATLAVRPRSWSRRGSSQNTTGVPDRRARVTASFTQSRIGASLVWHIRQMSPALTGCCSSTVPCSSMTRTVPSPLILKVLSWLPYSSAACAIRPTLGTLPIVAGSNAPCSRQSSITAW